MTEQREYAQELAQSLVDSPPSGLVFEAFNHACLENTPRGLRIMFDRQLKPLIEGREKKIGAYIHGVLGLVTISFHYSAKDWLT